MSYLLYYRSQDCSPFQKSRSIKVFYMYPPRRIMKIAENLNGMDNLT